MWHSGHERAIHFISGTTSSCTKAGVLRKAARHRCITPSSCQESPFSEHQIELIEICLLSKIKLDKGLKSEKRIAETIERDKNKVQEIGKLTNRRTMAKHLKSVTIPRRREGIQKAQRDGLSVKGVEKILWLEPTELQSVPGNSFEIHPEIQESKFKVSNFWWYSMGSTELGSRDKRERLENCEDYIDFMYDKLFETQPPNKEILSTPQEYEEWLDKKFDETVTNSFLSLHILEKRQKSKSTQVQQGQSK